MTSIQQTLFLLLAAQAIIVMVPGMNTALVLRTAARDRTAGFMVALGVWPAGLIGAAAGLGGLGTLLLAWPQIALAMRVICGAYLLWIGAAMLAASFRKADHPGLMVPARRSAAFWQGFITNISNPKTIAHYSSVFAATGAFDLPFWAQALAVFLCPCVNFVWDSLLVILASGGTAQRWLKRSGRWIDRCAGAIMIAFGLKLLVQK